LSVNICQQFRSVSCLSHEKDLIDAETLAHVKVLNYDQFADLVLQFNRCISLK
ncbi:DsrH like protein, partial [Acinetobacter baumannii]|nr:DsrH like protein [Acinetobacter baumannii]